MLKKIILQSGLAVEKIYEAGNGREGLAQLESNWVDVVVADLNMPVMGGLEMITRIREKPELAQLPIVVVSTESSQTRIEQIRELGVGFIHKPFSPAQIREMILSCHPETEAPSARKILKEVAWEVFETLGGLIVRAEEGPPPSGNFTIRGSVRFSGHFAGTVAADVSESVLLVLANNMLGLELGFSSPERQRDCLGELVNVLCANLLSRLAGTKPVFNLEAPQILRVPPEEDVLEASRKRAVALLPVEDSWARLILTLDQPPADESSRG